MKLHTTCPNRAHYPPGQLVLALLALLAPGVGDVGATVVLVGHINCCSPAEARPLSVERQMKRVSERGAQRWASGHGACGECWGVPSSQKRPPLLAL